MTRLLALAGLVLVPWLQVALQVERQGEPGVEPRSAAAADELALLRELSELGASAEVLARFLPAVAPGAALAASGEARARLARAAFDSGDEELAFRLLDAAAAVDSPAALSLCRARLLMARDRLAEAQELLAAGSAAGALEPRFPEEPEAWLLLARLLVRQGQGARAEPFAERFLALAPLHPEAPIAWHLLGSAALARRDAESARACFDQEEGARRWHDLLRARRIQVRLNPDDPLPRLGVALLWLEAGALDEAEARLVALLAAHPGTCAAWQHLAEVRRRTRRFDLAEGDYARALECGALDALEVGRTRLQQARNAFEAGDLELAKERLLALAASPVGADPELAELHRMLAEIHERQGDAERARAERAAWERARGR